MRRFGMILAVVLVVVFGIVLFAQANDQDCDVFHNHSGFIPDSYDYANLYENGFEPLLGVPAGHTYPPPLGRSSWDTVEKCHNPEPTTTVASTSTTVTTVVLTTSTTVVIPSTTVPETSTSTVPETTSTSSTPTTVLESTTTSSSLVTPTAPPTTSPPELPYTGMATYSLLVLGLMTIGLGATLVKRGRSE